MEEIRTFRDLHAWQAGMDTMAVTYRLTSGFPSEERFGLVSQMRRASVSIASNVAEGAVRAPRWTLRHINTAIASATELACQLEAAIRLGFVSCDTAKALSDSLDRTQKLLYGMRRERQRRLGISIATMATFLLAALVAIA
jgi:four helix bundle protein